MKTEEAITRIQNLIEMFRFRDRFSLGIATALDMAIEALKAQDVPDTNVGDMISRQAAIDALRSMFVKEDGQHLWRVERNETIEVAIEIIQELPSTQPEQSESEGVTFWKKRAREYEAMLGELTTKITEGMTVDSIVINKDGIVFKGLQPERKKGKGMEFDSDEDRYAIIKCPCCKHTFTVDSFHWTDIGFVKDDVKFCPNCGADMREGDGNDS